ncbi:EpsG family protein [Evansella sp. LMS18]|uniref:EpsG family protein n=1 Tax=Evansella sp. LMS18 TaxID=2924033 RepID=UPI0020D0C172|nr:EpsG family protein [Evansella sp. LMS18]UTR10581.1 EpsG family protein [Evansella sp. LMS18]
MEILYANLAIVFSFSLFSRFIAVPSAATSLSPVPVKPSKLFAFGAMVTLVIISGLRRNIGDTYFYRHTYETNQFTWEIIREEKDMGFGILQMLLQQISSDPQILIFTTALITNVLIVIALYNYARMFELALYVYITGGFFLVSMNGIRQFLAAAIIFAATKYIIDGSWKKFTLVVLLASTFHQSALIFIPIYFLIRRKAWTKTTAALLALAVIIVIGYNHFSEMLFSAISDTQYGGYSDFAEGGANIIRIAVNAAPLILAYLGRDKLREVFPNSDYFINLCLLNFVFMVISLQNWLFARFSIYFGLYQLILIAWIVKVFKEKDQKLIYYLILIFYFIYFYYEHVHSLHIEYRSDFFDL